MTIDIRNIIPSLPNDPGVYRYYDEHGHLLYVGKAKNIRKRVASYFTGKQHNRKTQELVSRINAIEFTIVHSEADALLLENILIKQHKPVFNIELKDDKTYPYIVIKNEPFPRIFLTRKKINDGSTYLGPFTSVRQVRDLIEFVRKQLPVRTCKLNLSEKNISSGKFKLCLEYQLGNCKGPCTGLQSMDDYMAHVGQIKNILEGNLRPVLDFLRKEMQDLSRDMKFEKAAHLKHKITQLESYHAKSVVVNSKVPHADVFYYLREDHNVFVNYMMVRNGMVVATDNTELEVKIEEEDNEIFATVINNMRSVLNSNAEEIIIPFEIEWMIQPNIKVTVPKTGAKWKLLEMSRLNIAYLAKQHQMNKTLHLENKGKNIRDILAQVQEKLHLIYLPEHIECFDNSNLHGTYPVSAMVCFKNGMSSKNDYRKFHVKTVKGINDFATMKEVVYRRYSALLKKQESLPQLVIIDGGKGQLSAAAESISALGLKDQITLIGLAKNVEEIFFVGDKDSLKLPIDNPALLFIRKIRDEVHRFGIEFHRQQRSKGFIKNELENIPGIGKKTIEKLLQEFKSVESISRADISIIQQLIGKDRAEKIDNYIKKRGQDRHPAPSLKSNIL